MTESNAPTLRLHPDVVWRRIGTTAVVIDVPSSQIFELNATGARIWELLSEGCDRDGIAERLAAEFTIDVPRARQEVDALIDTLRREQLLA